MEQRGSFLLALTPLLTTFAYLMREPDFNLLRCIPYILPLMIPIFAFAPPMSRIRQLCGNMRGRLNRNARQMEYTARIRLNCWRNEPDSIVRNFSVVMWEWNRHNLLVNCSTINEEAIPGYWSDGDEGCPAPLFVNDSMTPFWNKNNDAICYKMWIDRNVDREGNSLSEVMLHIVFKGVDATPKTVVEHIEYLKNEAARIDRERQKKQRVLVSTGSAANGGGGGSCSLLSRDDTSMRTGTSFMIYEFATTSSFSNFFCEEATLVHDDLQHFLQNKHMYDRVGRPWTYTVLNEGPPGVGKTKLVKAIAALTGYTLIVINLAHIEKLETLYEAFHSSVLAGEHVPHNKRLYYIPEVDTQMFEILKSRDSRKTGGASTPTQTPAPPSAGAKPLGDGAYVKVVNGPENQQVMHKKPTLGEILNVLDGVPERYGHILVLDTNRISELDPALVRPGRVDRILSWSKLSNVATRKYIENYYDTILPKTATFPDKAYTAAELQAIVYKHKDWKSVHNEVSVKKLRGVATIIKD